MEMYGNGEYFLDDILSSEEVARDDASKIGRKTSHPTTHIVITGLVVTVITVSMVYMEQPTSKKQAIKQTWEKSNTTAYMTSNNSGRNN